MTGPGLSATQSTAGSKCTQPSPWKATKKNLGLDDLGLVGVERLFDLGCIFLFGTAISPFLFVCTSRVVPTDGEQRMIYALRFTYENAHILSFV